MTEKLSKALPQLAAELEKAPRALTRAGFTLVEGAQEWKPPIGPSSSPLLDRIDQLTDQLAGATRQCGAIAELLRETKPWLDFAFDSALSMSDEEVEIADVIGRIDALLAGKVLTAGVDVADGRFEIQIAEWSTQSETIRTAPARIWLQVGDQAHYHSEPFPSDTGDVTWCADSVVGCEVPYIRADLAGRHHAVPEGWQLAPVELTERMDLALESYLHTGRSMRANMWRDVLAAAPKPEGGA